MFSIFNELILKVKINVPGICVVVETY